MVTMNVIEVKANGIVVVEFLDNGVAYAWVEMTPDMIKELFTLTQK